MQLHGLVLTGGRSTRMGSDKATVPFGDSTLAARVARALRAVAEPVLVVGHDAGTGLPTVGDDGVGPLAAFVAGADALGMRGAAGPVILASCDLPFVTAETAAGIAACLGPADAAVPVIDGRDQPLLACYSPRARTVAADLVANGRRAMRDLLDALVVERVPAQTWARFADARAFVDVDTPEDLQRALRDRGDGHG